MNFSQLLIFCNHLSPWRVHLLYKKYKDIVVVKSWLSHSNLPMEYIKTTRITSEATITCTKILKWLK